MRIETKAKLDYLKETKAAIASALVEKGQTVASTDSFRSYADKVKAIKSGGGGFGAGAYFKPYNILTYGSYYQNWAWLNGELYCFRLPFSGGGHEYEVHKYTGDNKWTKIVEKTKLGANNLRFVLLNGKIHILGGLKYHHVFDGENLTKLNDVPSASSVGERSQAVYNGKLMCMAYNVLFEWNESIDEWTQVASHSTDQYLSRDLFVANNELYAYCNKKIYLYSNGTMTEVADLGANYTLICCHNNRAYFYDGNQRMGIFEPSTASFKSYVGDFLYLSPNNVVCFSDVPTQNPYLIVGTNTKLKCVEMIVVEDEG
jgi:hypothetical protein